jgi:hypothetical protein
MRATQTQPASTQATRLARRPRKGLATVASATATAEWPDT